MSLEADDLMQLTQCWTIAFVSKSLGLTTGQAVSLEKMLQQSTQL